MALVCAATVNPTAVAPAQGAAATIAGSLTLRPSTAIAQEYVVASGKLPTTVKRPVRLERKRGTDWLEVARATSNRSAFRFRFRARSTTTKYRVHAPRVRINGRRYADVVTPVKTLTVVPQTATLSAPTSAVADDDVAMTATFAPVRASRPVMIQRRDGGAWVDVAEGVQDAGGQVVLQVPVGSAGTRVFRARTGEFGGAPAATSQERTVTVTAPADTTPPGRVTDLEVYDVGRTTVDLGWWVPDDEDFAGVMIRRQVGTTPPGPTGGQLVRNVGAFTTFFRDTGLDPSTSYAYALFAYDEVPNYATPATVTARTLEPADTTPPGPVTTLTTTEVTYDHVSLAWTNPSDADLAGVMIRRRLGTVPPLGRSGGELVADVDATTTSFDDYGVGSDQTYSYALFAYDEVPNYATSATTTVTTKEYDVTAPGPVTAATVSAGTSSTLTLSWTNPTDADFAGVTIRRRIGATPPETPTEGTLVTDTDAAATSFVDSGLAAGRSYSYALFAHDEVPNYAWELVTVTGVTDTGGAVTMSDWPQGRQGPEHRNWSPTETAIRPSTIPSLAQEWSIPGSGTSVIKGRTLYVSGGADDGSSRLAAYDLTEGTLTWEKSTEDCAGQPSVAGTFVVVSCGEIRAYRLGGEHNLAWDTETTDPGQTFTDHLVLGDTVVAWSANRVTAYRLSDGQRVWQQLLPVGSDSVAGVAASGDRVVVSYGNRLRALGLATGAVLWTRDVTAFDVVVAGGWVYTRGDGTVRRYALADGASGWSVAPEHGVYRLFSVDADTVYVWSAVFDFGPPSPSILRALRVSDGSEKWATHIPSRVGTVAITGSVVWVTSTEIFSQGRSSDLIALNRADGGQMRRIHYDDNMYNWDTGAVFGAGKVVIDQGGSFGFPEPRRLRVLGIAGVRPDITTAVLPLGRVGTPYSHQLTAGDAPGPIVWSVANGALPSGLTLSSAGMLSGTPTTVGSTVVTLQATSSNGRSVRRALPIQVVPAVSPSDWASASRSGARNPFSPGNGALGIDRAAGFAFRWQTAPLAHAWAAVDANAVIRGSRTYTVAGSGDLRAYDLSGGSTRTPLWTATAPGTDNFFTGITTVADGVVVVSDHSEQRVHAFRATDGAPLWHTDPGVGSGEIAPLVVDGLVVVVGGFPTRIRAFSLTDGSPQWAETVTEREHWGELSTDGARIFGMADCVLYALDPATGAELWQTSTLSPPDNCGSTFWPQSAPIVAGGRVYASEPSSRLVADAVTGEAVLRVRALSYGAAGVVVGGVWVFPDDDRIVALDTHSGRRAWSVPAPAGGNLTVAATGDLLLVVGNDKIVGLDRLDGSAVWDSGTFERYGWMRSVAIAITADRILVPTRTGIRAYGPL